MSRIRLEVGCTAFRISRVLRQFDTLDTDFFFLPSAAIAMVSHIGSWIARSKHSTLICGTGATPLPVDARNGTLSHVELLGFGTSGAKIFAIGMDNGAVPSDGG